MTIPELETTWKHTGDGNIVGVDQFGNKYENKATGDEVTCHTVDGRIGKGADDFAAFTDAYKNNLKHCNYCDKKTVFYPNIKSFVCSVCGVDGYWQDIEHLKKMWLDCFRDGGMDDWNLEEDSGMEEYHDELLIFRLREESRYWKSEVMKRDCLLDKYDNFIEIARKIFK